MDGSNITFGTRLAVKRKAAGLTQEQLGEGMAPNGRDVGKGGVSSWECDRTEPSATQIAKLCRRLNCSADELLGHPGSIEPTAADQPSHHPSSRAAATRADTHPVVAGGQAEGPS